MEIRWHIQTVIAVTLLLISRYFKRLQHADIGTVEFEHYMATFISANILFMSAVKLVLCITYLAAHLTGDPGVASSNPSQIIVVQIDHTIFSTAILPYLLIQELLEKVYTSA